MKYRQLRTSANTILKQSLRPDRSSWHLAVLKGALVSEQMHSETAKKKRAVRKAKVSSKQMTETQLTRSAPFVKDTSRPGLALLAMCELTFPIPRGHWWRWLSYLLTLKNKDASRYHRRTFLSKWFHKESLTSEEPLCFTKDSLWWKKVLQIIKRQERDGSLKKLWLNGSLWNQK